MTKNKMPTICPVGLEDYIQVPFSFIINYSATPTYLPELVFILFVFLVLTTVIGILLGTVEKRATTIACWSNWDVWTMTGIFHTLLQNIGLFGTFKTFIWGTYACLCWKQTVQLWQRELTWVRHTEEVVSHSFNECSKFKKRNAAQEGSSDGFL